jgi:hypothetical protein
MHAATAKVSARAKIMNTSCRPISHLTKVGAVAAPAAAPAAAPMGPATAAPKTPPTAAPPTRFPVVVQALLPIASAKMMSPANTLIYPPDRHWRSPTRYWGRAACCVIASASYNSGDLARFHPQWSVDLSAGCNCHPDYHPTTDDGQNQRGQARFDAKEKPQKPKLSRSFALTS